MSTLKIITLTSLLAFSRYDAAGGCVANSAQSTADMNTDLGSSLQVTPTRMSMSSGATLQIDGGLALAGQLVQLKQGTATVPLGTLDAQGRLQKSITKTDLAPLALGTAQLTVPSGAQATVRLYLDPKLDNAPTPFAIGPVNKTGSTPLWIGIVAKKIISLNFKDASGVPGMPIISQSIGEYTISVGGEIGVASQPIYRNYSSFVFDENFNDQGMNFKYFSTGMGLTMLSIYVAEYFSANKSTIMRRCPLDAGCDMTLVPRPYSRITSLTSDSAGSLFAAIVTSGGSVALKAFREGTLGAATDIVGGNTALPHETMLGVGRLDEDDAADLIALLPTGVVAVWLGGQGRLTASDAVTGAVQQALAGVTAPSALGVGDLDGDGLDDVVVASNAKLVMLMNQGGGRFSALAGPTVPAGLAPVTSVAVGDVSVAGKGIADLVLGSQDQHSIGAIENSATY